MPRCEGGDPARTNRDGINHLDPLSSALWSRLAGDDTLLLAQ